MPSLLTIESQYASPQVHTRQATISAWLVSPRESCNIRVSLLSLYGTHALLLFNAYMTLDKAKSD